MHSFSGHRDEGFALDWSPKSPGIYYLHSTIFNILQIKVNSYYHLVFFLGFLASGDCKGNIHTWKPNESGWVVNLRSLTGHKESVEDLQWSPIEINILASCSVDRS